MDTKKSEANEQEHQIDLATALGEEVPRIEMPHSETREPAGAARR